MVLLDFFTYGAPYLVALLLYYVTNGAPYFVAKVHLFLKWCLHDLLFMKIMSFSPNLSKLAPAGIS
jgi:hypothetical protein